MIICLFVYLLSLPPLFERRIKMAVLSSDIPRLFTTQHSSLDGFNKKEGSSLRMEIQLSFDYETRLTAPALLNQELFHLVKLFTNMWPEIFETYVESFDADSRNAVIYVKVHVRNNFHNYVEQSFGDHAKGECRGFVVKKAHIGPRVYWPRKLKRVFPQQQANNDQRTMAYQHSSELNTGKQRRVNHGPEKSDADAKEFEQFFHTLQYLEQQQETRREQHEFPLIKRSQHPQRHECPWYRRQPGGHRPLSVEDDSLFADEKPRSSTTVQLGDFL